MQDLIVLSHEDYTDLKHTLKAAGLDVCYTAPSARPLRRRRALSGMSDPALLQQITQRRPADPGYRLASVQCTKAGNWLWPDRLTVTFHAVSPRQDAALVNYLATHPVSTGALHGVPPAAAVHGQATPATYVQVALILALITAFEVAVMYVPHRLLPPRWTVLLVLLLLSTLKGGIVVSFFMHLRYDHRLYTGLFLGGVVVAAGTILALLALFREPPAGMSAAAAMSPPVPSSVMSAMRSAPLSHV